MSSWRFGALARSAANRWGRPDQVESSVVLKFFPRGRGIPGRLLSRGGCHPGAVVIPGEDLGPSAHGGPLLAMDRFVPRDDRSGLMDSPHIRHAERSHPYTSWRGQPSLSVMASAARPSTPVMAIAALPIRHGERSAAIHPL
jgi:hypothetical protein